MIFQSNASFGMYRCFKWFREAHYERPWNEKSWHLAKNHQTICGTKRNSMTNWTIAFLPEENYQLIKWRATCTIFAAYLNPIIWLLCLCINAASPLTCIKDHPRKGEKLTLSPSGTLAAITDSLGRILLLDTQALVVVRLWKVFFWTFRSWVPDLPSPKKLSKTTIVFP